MRGVLRASDGESATFSGKYGVSVAATFDSAGNGTGTETFNGSVQAQYVYADGSTGSVTIPFNLPPFNIQTQLGHFQINEQVPVAFGELQFGISVNGTVDRDLTQITESLSRTASGTYNSISVSGMFSSSGTLTAAPPPVSPVSISGTGGTQSTGDTSAVAPFRNASISDPNAGVKDTVQITLSNSANGRLSNLGGGSFNASTGVFTVSGSVATVNTTLHGLVFTPTIHQAATGQTVTTSFTISVSDTAGQSASGGTTNVATTETLRWTLSVGQESG